MRKLLTVLFLIPICAAVCGCGGKNCRDINYQKYPLDVSGVLTYDGNEYSVDVSVPESGDIEITVLLPERLKGAAFSLRDGICSFNFAGVGSELDDGGYSASSGILLSAEMFALTADAFAGSEVITENGVRYCAAEYKVDSEHASGTVRVFTQSGLSFPEKITAELNGHSLSFVFAKENIN